MYLRRENIINFFDDVMKREIIKFCKRINDSEADVFILMARKAACFFQVLVENGLIDNSVLKKKIVTDRSVDFSNNYLKGKKILIIDDVIFSGSTIAKMVLYLKNECGVAVEDISILILAVNKDTFRMQFISDEVEHDIFRINDSAKLENADCTRLCGDISRILSILGKPYDVDFPAYHDLYLESDVELPWVVMPQYWNLYNVSNEYHNQVGIEAYTLIPSKLITGIIWRYLGINLDDVAEYKIRIYSLDNSYNMRFKIVSMVVFHEMTYDTLNYIFDKICKKIKEFHFEICPLFNNESAKLRFLQYYVANLLYDAFFLISDLPIPKMRKYSLPYLFGYDYLELLRVAIEQSSNDFCTKFNQITFDKKDVTVVFSVKECNDLGYVPNQEKKFNTFDINLRLLEPFIYWYKQSEIPAREKLADSKIDLNDTAFFNSIKRLEVGFSFRCIRKFMNYAKEYYNIDRLVSIFIDRAVDLGLLVPIIFDDGEKKIICRAFRHGEDLPFGDGDQEVLFYFLEIFFDEIKEGRLSHLQFQKIVVLFI